MRIDVRGDADVLTDQWRAYAEYRVFAALSRFSRAIERAAVRLERAPGGDHAQTTCAIELVLGDDEQLACESSARQLSAAIDRAAECARRECLRHEIQASGFGLRASGGS